MAKTIAVSCVVATVAFWAYTRTLLPGVDLGDTGGFQAAVLWPEVSARQAYPLYYGLARPFVLLTLPDNPARALNLLSAVWAAAAAGLLTFVCASVTRSLAGGVVAGLLLAFSYTFWTQAVIAEVYSLHLALIGCCWITLLAYAARPTPPRLLLFFAVYALSFGNHLSMILLLLPFAMFLVQASPQRRELVRPRIVAAGALLTAAGALQYAPNFMSAWNSFTASEAALDRVATFWFDVTKQDWRATMVLGVDAAEAADRLAMWWFDARQQFGVAGLAMAAVGAIGLWLMSRPWAVLVLASYALTTAFALTYNVGDSHVFFLPAHLMTAFCAGASVAAVTRRAGLHGLPWRDVKARPTIAAFGITLAIGYAGWRGWSTWPVVDRHTDRRGDQLIGRLTAGITDRDALFVSQMNWQLENVLLYSARYTRRDLAWVRLPAVMPHWPFIVEDNERIGRDLVLSAEAAADVIAAYGPAFPLVPDAVAPVVTLPDATARIPRGTPYVLTVLTPPTERPLDPGAFAAAFSTLTREQPASGPRARYEVFAGLAGESASVHLASNRPFTEQFQLLDERFTVRMESWLPFDTFRRAGFGHVLRRRERILILERGVSLVWLGRHGTPSAPYYAASVFAPEPRYRLRAATLQLAHNQPPTPNPQAPVSCGIWREP